MTDTAEDATAKSNGNVTDLSQLQKQIAELTAQLEAALAEQERLKTEKLRQADRAYKAEQKLKQKQTEEENAAAEMQQKFESVASENEALKNKINALESSKKRAEVYAAIAAASHKLADGAGKYLGEILLNRVGIDEDGEVVVLNESGKRRINPNTGKPMRAQELLDEITAQPDARFLLKAAATGGGGAHGRTDGGGNVIDLEQLNAMSAAERAVAFAKLTPEQRAEIARKASN